MVSSGVGARMECKREVTKEGNGEFWGWGEDGVLKGGNKGREW